MSLSFLTALKGELVNTKIALLDKINELLRRHKLLKATQGLTDNLTSLAFINLFLNLLEPSHQYFKTSQANPTQSLS